MATLLNAAAVQRRAPMGSPMSTTLSSATSTIFRPETGVATETSPVVNASSVKTCPAKKSTPATTGCHHKENAGIVPPSSQNGTAIKACV